MKRTIALLAALEIAWTAPGLAAFQAFAQITGRLPSEDLASQVPPSRGTEIEQALDALAKQGALKPEADRQAMMAVLQKDGGPTVAGQLLLAYVGLLRSQGSMDSEYAKGSVEKIGGLLSQLGDGKGPKVAERREAELKNLEGWVGTRPVNDHDLYAVGTAMVVVLTRLLAPAGATLNDKVAVEQEGDVLAAYDRKTFELYRKEDSTGRILYSKEILERQKRYSEMIGNGQVDGALPIHLTGKLDYATLLFPYTELSSQLEKSRAILQQGELVALLEITNRSGRYTADQLADPKLQAQLLAELRETKLPDGRLATYYLSPSFKARKYYLDEAQHYVDSYKQKVEGVKASTSIPNALMAEIDRTENDARGNLRLAFLEGSRSLLDTQIQKISDPDFDKTFKDAPVDPARLAAYLAQKQPLLDRGMQLRRLYTDEQNVLAEKPEQGVRKRAQAYAADGLDLDAAFEKAEKDYTRDQTLAQAAVIESKDFGHDLQVALNTYGQTAGLLKATYDANATHESLVLGKGFLWTGLSVKRGVDLAAEFANSHFGWFGGYVSDLHSIETNEAKLNAAFDNVAAGNFKLAQAELMGLTSAKEYGSKLNIDSGGGVSDLAVMQASVEAYQEKLKNVQNVHFWSEFAGNIVLTSALAGVAAPLGRVGTSLVEGAFTGIANRSRALAGALEEKSWMGYIPSYAILRPIGFAAYAAGRVFDNMSRGLESLNNVEHVPGFIQKGLSVIPSRSAYWALVRSWNMFQREAVAAAMLGGISGGMEAGRYLWNPEQSHYKDGWEAFKTGAKFGADFSVKPQNLPWLFGGGLPADLFGLESRLGRVWFNFGNQGLVGGALESFNVPWGKAMAGLAKAGGLGFGASFTLGMADQMLKYYAGAWAIGQAAEFGYTHGMPVIRDMHDWLAERPFLRDRGWVTPGGFDLWRDKAGATPEEQRALELKRAIASEKFGADVMQQAWRFMPVASMRFGSAEEYYAAEHGAKQYREAGLRTELANAAPGKELNYLRPPELPGFQRWFLRGSQNRTAKVRTFRASDDMILNAIREELAERSGGDPSKLLEIMKMEESEEGKPVYLGGEEDGLLIRREVKAEAWEMYKKAIRKSPELAASLMRSAVTAEREDAALAVLQNAADRNVFQRAASTFSRSSAAQVRLAEKILEPFIKTERAMNEAGEALVKATKEIKKPSEGLKSAIEEIRKQTAEMKASTPNSGDPRPIYAKLLDGWRSRIAELRNDKSVKPAEARALSKMVDYLETFQERLNTEKSDGKALVQDAKGSQIRWMRPPQFDITVDYLTAMVERGKDPSKTYAKLMTGGGKTFLVFEALLPVILADAKLGPSTGLLGGKPKVVFTTISTTLQSQARTDFKAFRKILSDVEILTSEQFKTKLAEGKMLGKTKPEDFWIILDESDGVALQPALTIGHETHVATKEHAAYRRAETVVEELKTLAESDLPASDKRAGASRLRLELQRALLDGKAELKAGGEGYTPLSQERRAALRTELEGRGVRFEPKPEGWVSSKVSSLADRFEGWLRSSDSPWVSRLADRFQTWRETRAAMSDLKAASKGLKLDPSTILKLAEYSADKLVLDARAEPAAGPEVRARSVRIAESAADALVAKTAARQLLPMFDAMAKEAWRGAGKDAGAKVQELQKDYENALGKAMRDENPIYEAYRTMKEQDATRFADSELLYKGIEQYRNRQTLESIGRKAVEAAKNGDAAAAELAVKDAERLLAKDENGQYMRIRSGRRVETAEGVSVMTDGGPQIEIMRETLGKLREVAQGRAKAEPAQIELAGRRYQEALDAGVEELDAQAAFEKDLTVRTRARGWELFKAFWKEPTMDGITRTRFMVKALRSALTGQGWVRQEMLNLVQGRLDGDANVRMDNVTGKVHPIHNGEFVPTMDTPTRRYYELEHGADLTLPYEHDVLTTVNDIIESKAGQFHTSGTGHVDYLSKFEENGGTVIGDGTADNEPTIIVKESPTARMNEIARRVETGLLDAPVVGKAIEARVDVHKLGALKSELATASSPAQVNRAFNRAGVSDPSALAESLPAGRRAGFVEAVQAWAQHGGRDLEVVGLSNTRQLKWVRKMLLKQGLKADQIAMIFSDVEYIGNNYPKSNIKRQMNLESLASGQVKVLLVDVRVGGRGLDLPFKGNLEKKGGTFPGYENVETLIDPLVARDEDIQFQGRTAPNRLNSGARRDYYYLIDEKTADKNPTLHRAAETRGLQSVDASMLANRQLLHTAQDRIEKNMLRQSQVSTDAPAVSSMELPIH